LIKNKRENKENKEIIKKINKEDFTKKRAHSYLRGF